jgi:L-ascorbate metabolism protein UlaG (beta-lactamase superfamily)
VTATFRVISLVVLSAVCVACGNTAATRPIVEGQNKAPEPATQAEHPEELVMETSMGTVKIYPIWHGTLAFEINGTVIVIDPWSKAPAERLPKADVVLITDNHQDHFDESAIAQVVKADSVVLAPQVVVEKFPKAEPIANGEQVTKHGIGILAVPMYNEKRGPEEGKLFHDKGRGNGYVLSFGETKIYISGDTECISEMRSLASIDLAFVCMNLPYTMPPEEAAECIKAFRPKKVVPYHYRGSDLGVLAQALEGEAGIELRLVDFYLP